MTTHQLTVSDVKAIKERSTKIVDSDGSIIYKMDVFYRFNDVSIMVAEICGKPYNEIEIHGKLKTQNGIDESYSSCEVDASDDIFELLIQD